jgi:hypothetical protein
MGASPCPSSEWRRHLELPADRHQPLHVTAPAAPPRHWRRRQGSLGDRPGAGSWADARTGGSGTGAASGRTRGRTDGVVPRPAPGPSSRRFSWRGCGPVHGPHDDPGRGRAARRRRDAGGAGHLRRLRSRRTRSPRSCARYRVWPERPWRRPPRNQCSNGRYGDRGSVGRPQDHRGALAHPDRAGGAVPFRERSRHDDESLLIGHFAVLFVAVPVLAAALVSSF